MSLYSTYIDSVGDGATTDFSVPFAYLDKNDVKVTVGGVTTAVTFLNSNTIRISPAPVNAAAIRVSRSTTISDPRVVFANGSSTTAQQLNKIVGQLLFALQEAADQADIGNAIAAAAKAEADAAAALVDDANDNANFAVTTANTALTTANTARTAATAAADAAAISQAAAIAASAAASVHNALSLPYDNGSSHLGATNVQEAIDLIAGATGITVITTDSIDNNSIVSGAKITNALNTLYALINALATVAETGNYADLTGKPALAPVATSGAYGDLSGKPTLGTAAPKNIGTVADLRANSGTDVITTDEAWAAAGWVNLGTISGAVSIDCNNGSRFYGTLAGNVTLTATNLKEGQNVELAIMQGPGGHTISWSNFSFPDGTAPIIATGAGAWAVFFSGFVLYGAASVIGSGWKIS